MPARKTSSKKAPAEKSTTKKSTSTKTKKTSTTKQPAEDVMQMASIESTGSTPSEGQSETQSWRKRFFIPIVLIVLAVLAYFGMQQLVVATVNGTPISRITLMKEMESQIGEQVLDTLVTKELIMQEAREQGITVSEEEIDEEIAELKEQFTAQGQDFDQLISMQGFTQERVREEIRLQKIVEKTAGADIEVSEEEIDEFIEQNSSFLPEDQDTDDPEFRDEIREQLKQQKSGEVMNSWVEELKAEADIKYFGPFANNESDASESVPPPAPEDVQVEEIDEESPEIETGQ